MKKVLDLLVAAVALVALVGCNASTNNEPANNPPASVQPIQANIGYYGNDGSVDSAGKSVAARTLFIMKSDSSFKMYISPRSLPLYHPRSSFEALRIRGRFQSMTNSIMTFSVDSSLSFWSDSFSVRRGTVVISSDLFYPNTKYVVVNFLSINEGIMAKGEYSVSHADSNTVAQFDMGL